MKNRFILTPYFLDAEEPAVGGLARSGWVANRPALKPDGQYERMSGIHESLAECVHHAVRGGDRPVSIAGDCCAVVGVLAGLQRAGIDPTLVWLDAHGDFNTHETTISGFLGGMPLAMISGRGEQALLRGVGLRPIEDDDIVLADARDLDPGERQLLEGSRVRHVSSLEELSGSLPSTGPLYVHLDPDVIDCADAPAMRYPVRRGPRVDSVRQVLSALCATGRVVAASLTCWQVDDDPGGQTARACLTALGALIGEPLSWIPEHSGQDEAPAVVRH